LANSKWKATRFAAFFLSVLLLGSCIGGKKVHVVEGLDISHHNTVTDWSAVKAEFIFIKATEGSNWVDPDWEKNRRGAVSAGIPVGAYHFMTTSSDAEAQFNNFKSVVDKESIDLLPVLDIEKQTPGHILPRKELQAQVRIWVELCEQYYGKKPILYSKQAFYLKNFAGALGDCLYWCGEVDSSEAYVSFTDWCIWQYKISHTPGIKGKVDHNRISTYHTFAELWL
jgi:lysozyme